MSSEMTAIEFEEFLAEAIETAERTDSDDTECVPEVRTYKGRGVMTHNRGLVVRIGGAEFHVAIARSE